MSEVSRRKADLSRGLNHQRESVLTANSDLFEMMDIFRLPRNAISMCILSTVLAIFQSAFRSRASVELENFALRHQLNVLKRSVNQRPKLTPADRLF